MLVYRIVKSKKRANDLSGIGAFKAGGRWNSRGTYMLYTSETSSLAYLETLVHFDDKLYPPGLFIMEIEVDESQPIFMLPTTAYPANWKRIGLHKNKTIGDEIMNSKKFIGLKVKSVINVIEHNYLLNPLYPRFNDFVRIKSITEIPFDKRFSK